MALPRGGAIFISALPKRAMHQADGGRMKNNEDTNRTNRQRKPGTDDTDNKRDAGRRAY